MEFSTMVVVPDTLCLRHAAYADAPALAALRTEALIELGLLGQAEAPAFRSRARREIATMLREDRLVAWVLVAGERLAGCACVVFWDRLPYPGSSRHAEIAGVYVAPAYRRRGIARELVGEALASARAHAVRRVFIAPTAQMRAFYREFGFDDASWLRSPLHASGTESCA
jgi:N-acetylglutamate synthase-like GNAT family acetyltransferase